MNKEIIRPDSAIPRLVISKASTPSWKRSHEAEGCATVDIQAHRETGNASIVCTEYNKTANRTVRTIISLTPEEAKAIRDYLVATLPA